MERLLNLLQEFYWENRKFSNDDWLLTMTNWVENLSGAYAQTYIISLMGGFIKWLVENDKIDTDAYKTVYSGDLDKRKTLTMSSGWDEFYQVTEHWVYESLLMLLSISSSPIEDLISYLR